MIGDVFFELLLKKLKAADKSDLSQRSFFRFLEKLFDFRNLKVSNVKKSARLSLKKSVLLTVGRQIFKKSRDKH